MLQEIIVYLILFLTALYLLIKSVDLFKSEKVSNYGSCSSGGSCSSCSLKIDLHSIHPEHQYNKANKSKFIQVKN